MSDVLLATSAQAKTMADGTLRISFDFSPDHKHAAFSLFGDPGSTAAIARLTDEAAKAQMQEAVIAEARPKGGTLSRDAAMLCAEPKFHGFLVEVFDVCIGDDTLKANTAVAVDYMRNYCRISSRAELDHNQEAADKFRELHRKYGEWVRGNDDH